MSDSIMKLSIAIAAGRNLLIFFISWLECFRYSLYPLKITSCFHSSIMGWYQTYNIAMQVHPGIIIGNGETVCDISYLKSLGVTHVLNTAEQHVMVNPAKYANHGIQYYGFHVDDLPHCDISR